MLVRFIYDLSRSILIGLDNKVEGRFYTKDAWLYQPRFCDRFIPKSINFVISVDTSLQSGVIIPDEMKVITSKHNENMATK